MSQAILVCEPCQAALRVLAACFCRGRNLSTCHGAFFIGELAKPYCRARMGGGFDEGLQQHEKIIDPKTGSGVCGRRIASRVPWGGRSVHGQRRRSAET